MGCKEVVLAILSDPMVVDPWAAIIAYVIRTACRTLRRDQGRLFRFIEAANQAYTDPKSRTQVQARAFIRAVAVLGVDICFNP